MSLRYHVAYVLPDGNEIDAGEADSLRLAGALAEYIHADLEARGYGPKRRFVGIWDSNAEKDVSGEADDLAWEDKAEGTEVALAESINDSRRGA